MNIIYILTNDSCATVLYALLHILNINCNCLFYMYEDVTLSYGCEIKLENGMHALK